MHLLHFQLYLYEKLLQVLLRQHLPFDWLIGTLIESGSSVHTCDKFALWQDTGDFHADIHKICILAGGGAGHVAFVCSEVAQY